MKTLSRPTITFRRPAPLFGARTLWGIAIGALAAITACTAVGLVSAQMGFYSRAVTVVWTLQTDKAAWRGALLGLLTGWLAHTRPQLLRVYGLSVLLLLLLDWREQLAAFMPYSNLFDAAVTLNYLLFTLLICAVVFFVLRRNRARIKTQPPPQ